MYSDETHIDGISQMQHHEDLFGNLTKRTFVDTDFDIVSVAITYDSKYAVCITAHDKFDKESKETVSKFKVVAVNLDTYKEYFTWEQSGKYIKMNQIEQNANGSVIGLAYQDMGKYYVTILDMEKEGEEIQTLNVSDLLKLGDDSKGIHGFWEPMITISFMPNNKIFIGVYHRMEMQQYHFIYEINQSTEDLQFYMKEIENCTTLNFPVKSFYSEVTKDIYVFYRQGQCITVNSENPENYKIENITSADLGNMYLVYDQALVVRSSSSILFFKIDENTGLWTKYH